MNTVEEIQTALSALVVQMTEKGVVMPKANITIKEDGSGWAFIAADYSTTPFYGEYSVTLFGATPAECLTAASAYIADLPDPDERVTREYLSKVAVAIDYATEHSLPDEYVAPLRGVSTAMTSNLLTHEAAE